MPLYMPNLYEEETSRSMTASFYGLNRNLRIGDGEWFDMQNLTSDHLPVLSVREKRATLSVGAVEPIALVGGPKTSRNEEQPIWIEANGRLCIGTEDNSYDLKPYGFDRYNKHQMVFMGAYLIVAPEMIYVNTVNTEEIGSMADTWKPPVEATIAISVCDYDGNKPEFVQVEDPTVEDTPSNGDLWYKTGGTPKLYRFDSESESWYEVESYLEVQCRQVSEPLKIDLRGEIKAGDVLRISGAGLDSEDLRQLIGDKYVSGVGGVYGVSFWVEGTLKTSIEEIAISKGSEFSISRAIPKMEQVTVADNRMWGAYYGEITNDLGETKTVNEIYSSRRGDFSRWYLGPSDDEDSPVTFSVGSLNPFTGAATFASEPIFFKEDKIYRIAGVGASGFQIVDAECEGVMSAGGGSLAVVNNALYYKGINHIMRYDGSVPVSVSSALGDLRGFWSYGAAAVGNKYYVMLQERSGKRNGLYVLDTGTGIWMKESVNGIAELATAGDTAFWRSYNSIGSLRPHAEVGDDSGWKTNEKPIEWFAESGIIGLETPDEKYLTKIAIRLKMATGSTVRVSVQYDSMGGWKRLGAPNTPTMKTVTIPIIPEKCDHLRFRLDGVGECHIFSITKTFEKAGEM